jgi:hypothetical protein
MRYLLALMLLLMSCGGSVAKGHSGAKIPCEKHDSQEACEADKGCKWDSAKSNCTHREETSAPDPCLIHLGEYYCRNDRINGCHWDYKKANCTSKKVSSSPEEQ